jgi:2'-5' RNA ligase
MQQCTFDFIKEEPWRPKWPERIFFGLLPNPQGRGPVGEFAQSFISENGLAGDQLDVERYHVSLHHLGDYGRVRSRVVYAATLAAKSVRMQPFEVTFGRLASFRPAPSRKKWPLVLLGESDDLQAFHALLGASIWRNGLRAAVGQFTPHMTLLYGWRQVREQPIEPIRIVFDEFFLIHSEKGLGRYNVLGRWPLQS